MALLIALFVIDLALVVNEVGKWLRRRRRLKALRVERNQRDNRPDK